MGIKNGIWFAMCMLFVLVGVVLLVFGTLSSLSVYGAAKEKLGNWAHVNGTVYDSERGSIAKHGVVSKSRVYAKYFYDGNAYDTVEPCCGEEICIPAGPKNIKVGILVNPASPDIIEFEECVEPYTEFQLGYLFFPFMGLMFIIVSAREAFRIYHSD